MNIKNIDDTIDTRDIIKRIEELEDTDYIDDEEAEELKVLQAFMDELKGNGENEQWREDWYPVTCIRDSYFKQYAQELAGDIGALPDDDAVWPFTCIDWDLAARQLQVDYTSVKFGDVTYCVGFGDVTYWVR